MINGERILPEDFIKLKNRIKAEVKRRRFVGSVESYGNATYDYEKTPTENDVIELEHISKISECVGAINDTNIKKTHVNGDTITQLAVMDAEITKFEKATQVGSNSGCKASCTGMCTTSCSGTCTSGCSGTCSGCSGCGGSCSNNCSGGCSGCSGACSGCGGSCSYGCSGGCSGKCSGSCGSYCGGSCTGAEFCSGGCSGCCTGCDSYSSKSKMVSRLEGV